MDINIREKYQCSHTNEIKDIGRIILDKFNCPFGEISFN